MMDELKWAVWRGRLAALVIELAALDALLERREEMYGFEAEFYVQRRRAVLTEMKALRELLTAQDPVTIALQAVQNGDGRVAHEEGAPVAHRLDMRQRGPL